MSGRRVVGTRTYLEMKDPAQLVHASLPDAYAVLSRDTRPIILYHDAQRPLRLGGVNHRCGEPHDTPTPLAGVVQDIPE